jgi:hypothetical protein
MGGPIMMPERQRRVFKAAAAVRSWRATSCIHMRLLLALLALVPLAGHALQTPPQMMANVFRFSEAGAVLEICFESKAFTDAPADRAAKLKQLAGRLSGLVKQIGAHWRDSSLLPTYEATRDRIAGESRLKLHVKNHYEYCGERLATEMEKYVAENEALIAPVFLTAPTKAMPRRPPDPPPVRK